MSDSEQILGRPKLDIYTPYDFETANKAYAAEYRFSQDNINRGARSRTAIITCIDSRSTPEHFFELKENEAFSIRNGGGRTSDPGTIRSLMLIQCHTELKEIKVVHHSSKTCPFLQHHHN
jgi:carbonic anhydrase